MNVLPIGIICLSLILTFFAFFPNKTKQSDQTRLPSYQEQLVNSPTVFPTPTPTIVPLPISSVIPLRTQIFQTFNNCGPASLSMLLSYYDIDVSQAVLGRALRPHQNAEGINDDKSVFVSELAEEAQKRYGLFAYYRPNGTIEQMKRLLSSGFPILVRTWLEPHDDIGHYRILRGYDDRAGAFIQDDSYQGKNIQIPYDQFNDMWKAFHYEYLVLAKPEERQKIESLLGNESDSQIAWDHMYERAERELQTKPSEAAYSNFSMSVASFYKGEYQQSVDYYEKAKHGLPRRMLWYQIEPVESYLHIENYEQVFSLSNDIFQDQNKGFSELYLLRAKAYIAMGNIPAAREELQQAIFYNQSLSEPHVLLSTLE